MMLHVSGGTSTMITSPFTMMTSLGRRAKTEHKRKQLLFSGQVGTGWFTGTLLYTHIHKNTNYFT